VDGETDGWCVDLKPFRPTGDGIITQRQQVHRQFRTYRTVVKTSSVGSDSSIIPMWRSLLRGAGAGLARAGAIPAGALR
jgi:hypothetical protein